MKKGIAIFLIIVLVLVASFFVVKNMTGNVTEVDSDKHDWLNDNCDCVERENLMCPLGYEVEEGLCRRGTAVTNPTLGCSKYECSDGEIWRIKL